MNVSLRLVQGHNQTPEPPTMAAIKFCCTHAPMCCLSPRRVTRSARAMTRFFGAKRALFALLVAAVLLQAYARPAEQSRELLDADDLSELDYEDGPNVSVASTGLVDIAAAQNTCPSAEVYRRTNRGCCES